MKTLVVTAALSLFALSNAANAQIEKHQSKVEAQLLASLPTFDEGVTSLNSHVNIVELLASLPTIDTNVEVLVSDFNKSTLLASLPVVDEKTETKVLFTTKDSQIDTKHHSPAVRLSEE
ncbi:MAG: hypothetical protein R2822_01405 [Spirosomataceae bacterium]